MMRGRSLFSALSLFALGGIAPVRGISAQGKIIDEGVFNVTKTGAAAHTESFTISRGDNGMIKATSHVISGSEQITSSLTADSLGTPLAYEFTVKEGSTRSLGVRAVARGGRLSTATSNQRGDESMKEYPLQQGKTVIFDDGLVHLLYFLPLAHRTGSIQSIEPRASRAGTLSLSTGGLEPIDVGGHSVTATHYTLTERGARTEFWVDGAGRLLRASIPAQGVTASREEAPK
jgi:hypothetical protein